VLEGIAYLLSNYVFGKTEVNMNYWCATVIQLLCIYYHDYIVILDSLANWNDFGNHVSEFVLVVYHVNFGNILLYIIVRGD
jgi:hypothetical protein